MTTTTGRPRRHRRVLNPRRLTFLLAAIAVAAVGVHLLHERQEARTTAALKELGLAAARDGRPDAAAEDLERYLALVPGDVEALAVQSEVLQSRAKDARARTRVFLLNDDLLRRDPDRHAARRRQVELAMSLGRFNDALTHLDVLRRAFPDDGELSFLTGRCREHLHDWSDAADHYREAIRLSPGLVAAYERLSGLLRWQLDRPAEAYATMDELIAAIPSSAAARICRASYRRRLGAVDDASADARAALALDDKSPEVLQVAGELAWARAERAQESGDLAAAREELADARGHLARGVELHPDNVGLQRTLALLDADQGQAAAGIQRLRDLQRRRPNDHAVTGMLSELLVNDGRADEARQQVDRLPSTDPAVAGLRHYLTGRVLASRGDWTAAAGELEAARAESAARPDLLVKANLHLAVCYERLGNFQREADAYRKVLEADPHSVTARLGLASLFRRSGRFREAVEEYRQVGHVAAVQPVLVRMLVAENLRLPELARDWKEVEGLIDRIGRRPHDPVDLALIRAEVHAVRGRRDQARSVLEGAGAEHPERPEPRLALEQLDELGQDGDAAAGLSLLSGSGTDPSEIAAFVDRLLRRGRLGEAETWLNRLTTLQPHSFPTLQLRTRLLLARGEVDAVAPLLRAFAADRASLPADAAVRTALVAALADELSQSIARRPAGPDIAAADELAAEAETLYRRYVERHPSQVLLLVGFLARRGRTGDAVEVSERAWETLRAELAAEASLVVLYAGRVPPEQMARLEQKLVRAVESEPESVPLRMSLADLRSLQTRYDEAEGLYRAVLASQPANVLALNNLAWLLALRGRDPQAALRHVGRAIELVGATPQLLDTRACVHLALGDGHAARADLRAALPAQPSAVSFLRLAAACELRGSPEEAESALRQAKALGLDPSRLHPLERERYRELCAQAAALEPVPEDQRPGVVR